MLAIGFSVHHIDRGAGIQLIWLCVRSIIGAGMGEIRIG